MASVAGMTAILTRTLPYRDLDTALTGALFLPGDEPRPGILLIHGGAGLDEHARDQAHRYAQLGYTVLACDMYGNGVTGDRERTMTAVKALRDDPDLLVRRGRAGLAALAASPETGPTVAAIGFCFGGLAALTLARAGIDLAGVVSIHGSLTTVRPARPGTLTARVLVCHGAADPHVPMEHVVAFADEMANANADWQLNMYGRALHGFTHRHGAQPGVAYDEAADDRSFTAVRAFLANLT
jgi:dienelactone hydrolase